MQQYTKIAIFLHWLIALCIVVAFTLGITFTNMHGITPLKLKIVSWHKWLGVTIFALAAIRILWRLFNNPPAYSTGMPIWEKQAAHAMHGLLYILIFAIPLTGYLMSLASGYPVVWLGLIQLPVLFDKNEAFAHLFARAHYVLNITLLVCFVLHVAAALKHHFVEHDDILRRMLPLKK